MKKKGMPAVHGSEVNVTPLIDVVMCLIIFFMLVAKIGVNKGEEKGIKLASTELGSKIDDMSTTITLNVRNPPGNPSKGIPYLYDVPLVSTSVKGEITPLNLVPGKGDPQARVPLADALKDMKKKVPNFKVIIRADSKLEYRFLSPVLIRCAEAGASNLNFMTQKMQVTQKAE